MLTFREAPLNHAEHYESIHRLIVEFYKQALAISREICHRGGEGNALWAMSLVLDTIGDLVQAIACAEDAVKIYEQVCNPTAKDVHEQLFEWLKQV